MPISWGCSITPPPRMMRWGESVMTKLLAMASLVVALIAFSASGVLNAQEIVFNGDFETKSYTPFWTLNGGNVHTELDWFQTVLYQTSFCLKRMPGPPDDNGGIEQSVYLVQGISYVFNADIAAQYCSS